MSGLYVHIPFCTARCPYCSFTSVPSPSEELMKRYVGSLGNEIGRIGRERPLPWKTLYIGGGTPSALTSKLLEVMLSNIFDLLDLSDISEVTIEANPESLDRDRLEVIAAGGVNRISIGVQSFSDPLLRVLGRSHTAAEARDACDRARRSGLENLSVDLMFGLPGQTRRSWEKDLRETVAAAPDHVSLYGLTIEEGTSFAARDRRHELSLPAEGETLDMYCTACDLLGEGGWHHYEISNWARPGRECRHNLDCWRLREYEGAGAGAHGFRRRPVPLRYGNVKDVEDYMLLAGKGKAARAFEERLEGKTLAAEGLMLGLRTLDGVNAADYKKDFGAFPRELFPEAFNVGCANGWTIERSGRVRFTFDGIIFSNEFFQLLF